jgi:hypothetical protein
MTALALEGRKQFAATIKERRERGKSEKEAKGLEVKR